MEGCLHWNPVSENRVPWQGLGGVGQCRNITLLVHIRRLLGYFHFFDAILAFDVIRAYRGSIFRSRSPGSSVG